jgi:hypothetical protein
MVSLPVKKCKAFQGSLAPLTTDPHNNKVRRHYSYWLSKSLLVLVSEMKSLEVSLVECCGVHKRRGTQKSFFLLLLCTNCAMASGVHAFPPKLQIYEAPLLRLILALLVGHIVSLEVSFGRMLWRHLSALGGWFQKF